MKALKFFSLFIFVAVITQSCLRDQCTATRNYVQFNPVYMTADELQYDIKTTSQMELVNPGKLYFYQNYIFINEQGLGIHVYNNEHPESPSYEVFYNIPGNFDIAIKDDILFADNPLYLMAIDIKNIGSPVMKTRNRIKDQDWFYENPDYQQVIYFTKSNIVETLDCSNPNFNNNRFFNRGNVFFEGDFAGNTSILNSSGETSNGGNGKTGVGGSSARFTIYSNYLYTVDQSALNVWDINSASSPEKLSSKNLGWGIETIFPYQDKLFIGSTSGMFIFDNSDPSNPIQTSQFRHAQACDPVVVSGDRAYVTLRDGNTCNGFDNQLDVIDVSNLYNPKLIKSFDMKHPHGLAIRDNNLFICEGEFGLKIFDASDDKKITNNQIGNMSDINAFDVISLTKDVLFVIGDGGFYQYNVSNIKKPKLISSIEVQE